MSYRKNLITHLFRLVHLARSAHLKRVLTEIDPDPDLNFWRLILGINLDIAVLEWCKVFGSNAENTHWKKIVPEDEHDNFRDLLLQNIGMSKEEWLSYWDSMKKYRDRQVAHYGELPADATYPVLDHAIDSSYFYYKYLITKFRALGETKYPDDLEVYCTHFSKQIRKIAIQAIASTSDISEEVF